MNKILYYLFFVRLALGTPPLVADGLHVLAHLLGDSDTLSVIPIQTLVTCDHEPVVVGLVADAPKTFGIIFAVPVVVVLLLAVFLLVITLLAGRFFKV